MGKVVVKVVYCSGCGHPPKFRKFQADLRAVFNYEIEIESEATQYTTGYFEVSINGELVHSKIRGDGHVNKADFERIINLIKEAMKQ